MTEEIDNQAQAALKAANAAARGEAPPGVVDVAPPAETPAEGIVAPAEGLPEAAPEAVPEAVPQEPIPTLAAEVQPEARKVDLLYMEISASAKRIGISPKGTLAAVLTHAAHIAIRLDYPACAALDEMITMLAAKVIGVGSRVKYTANGAVGVIESFQEKTGWAMVKWDHAPASPADLSTLEKL